VGKNRFQPTGGFDQHPNYTQSEILVFLRTIELTVDIEIIWQTHLLRPEMYRNDCLRLFRRVIDHSLMIKKRNRPFLKRTSIRRHMSTL
jgi:hypothetical protein